MTSSSGTTAVNAWLARMTIRFLPFIAAKRSSTRNGARFPARSHSDTHRSRAIWLMSLPAHSMAVTRYDGLIRGE